VLTMFVVVHMMCVCCVVEEKRSLSTDEMKELREGLDGMTRTLIEKRSRQLLRSRFSEKRSRLSSSSKSPPVVDPVTAGDVNLPKEKLEVSNDVVENGEEEDSDESVRSSEDKKEEQENVGFSESTNKEEKQEVSIHEGERFAEEKTQEKVGAGAAPWWLNPPPWWLPPPAEWGQPPATIYSDFYTSPHFKNGNYPASYPVYNPYPLH